jgi:hypothetical protein
MEPFRQTLSNKERKKFDVIECDRLDSELGILDYLFYQVCKDQQKKLAANL